MSSTLHKEAKRGRAEVNRTIYRRVSDAIGTDGQSRIDLLLAEPDSESRKTRWDALKQDAPSPTLTHVRDLLERQRWLALERPSVPLNTLNTLLPEVKLRQFALEAKSLDAARMLEMAPQKRYTLAGTLIELQNARVLDDLAEMFIKRMMRTHRHGREAHAMDRLKHQERTDGLIHRLHEVLLAWGVDGNSEERLAGNRRSVGTRQRRAARTMRGSCGSGRQQLLSLSLALLSGASLHAAPHLADSPLLFNNTRAVP
ncbi:MAG: hypothetical protein M3Y50_01515 [Acidobacteriota bacterium]|nr:hypothetical protein [Acidobacteriota bacterium]